MLPNIIIANFKPIPIGRLFDQEQLNRYTKFLCYHHQQNQLKKSEIRQEVTDSEVLVSDDSYEILSAHVDKYSISEANIAQRQILLFENVGDFITETMSSHFPIENYQLPDIFLENPDSEFGPKIGTKMEWYNEKMTTVFDNFYAHESNRPEHLIHVTCSGYTSPSVAQQAISARNWNNTVVTHSYQMGCYGAFPAIRTGHSLLTASKEQGRVDIVHTELLSAH